MHVPLCLMLPVFWSILLDLDGETSDGLDEVVVVGAAVWACDLLGELREAQGDAGRLQQRVLTIVALDARLTAGERCKEVVIVHCANLVRIPAPFCGAEGTGDLVDTHQAFEAHSREEERIVRLAFDLVSAGVSFQRGEIKGAINERKLVVYVELTATQDTGDLASSMECEARKNEGSRIVPCAISVVLHLDVVRVN